MKNILILGSDSFIAKALSFNLSNDRNRMIYLVTLNHNQLDIKDLHELSIFINKSSIWDVVINFANKGGRRTKIDSSQNFYDNLLGIENLIYLKSHYSRLILFTSGAEFDRRTNIFNNRINEYNSV